MPNITIRASQDRATFTPDRRHAVYRATFASASASARARLTWSAALGWTMGPLSGDGPTIDAIGEIMRADLLRMVVVAATTGEPVQVDPNPWDAEDQGEASPDQCQGDDCTCEALDVRHWATPRIPGYVSACLAHRDLVIARAGLELAGETLAGEIG
jgi:hypothetical protein